MINLLLMGTSKSDVPYFISEKQQYYLTKPIEKKRKLVDKRQVRSLSFRYTFMSWCPVHAPVKTSYKRDHVMKARSQPNRLLYDKD